jgi:hypothetical protein
MAEPDRFGHARVTFLDNAGGKFSPCRFGQGAYAGTFCENVVSGIARDLLTAALRRLEAARYRAVLHVHDEIVCEVPDGFGGLEEFKDLLTALPDWAEGLPVAAKAREGQRFSKPSEPAETIGERDALDELLDGNPDHNSGDPDRGGDYDGDYDSGDEERPVIAAGSEDGADADLLPWATPSVVEIAPGSPEFEAILASLDPEERAIVQPPEPNGGEERDQDAAGNGRDQDEGDRYPHGEHDNGREVAFFVYRHADGQPYLKVKKTSTKQFPQFHVENGRWVKGSPRGPKIP